MNDQWPEERCVTDYESEGSIVRPEVIHYPQGSTYHFIEGVKILLKVVTRGDFYHLYLEIWSGEKQYRVDLGPALSSRTPFSAEDVVSVNDLFFNGILAAEKAIAVILCRRIGRIMVTYDLDGLHFTVRIFRSDDRDNLNEIGFAGSLLGNNDAARLLAVSVGERPHSYLRRASAFHGMKGGFGDEVDVPGDEIKIEDK
ncbi:MAG: hypothetical protein WC560_12590 [Syntrophales bacterium]